MYIYIYIYIYLYLYHNVTSFKPVFEIKLETAAF